MSLDEPSDFVKRHSITHDAFLGGKIHVSQPQGGFRAGLDSVLLGAAVAENSPSLADLGAGVGTAALVALAQLPRLAATLVERDVAAAGLARANIARNGFAGRAAVLEMDVTARGGLRAAAGLADNAYASVIANPPFFAQGRGTPAPDGPRSDARQMQDAALDLWIRTAAASAAPGGEAIFIYPAPALRALLAGFEARFGAVTVLPLTPRPEAAASRVLVRGIKGSRAPTTLLASRALHGADGHAFSAPFEAILRGGGRLGW